MASLSTSLDRIRAIILFQYDLLDYFRKCNQQSPHYTIHHFITVLRKIQKFFWKRRIYPVHRGKNMRKNQDKVIVTINIFDCRKVKLLALCKPYKVILMLCLCIHRVIGGFITMPLLIHLGYLFQLHVLFCALEWTTKLHVCP